tara:strand:- start:527 stop:1372 length:846 start_codon:yes stop_codon:yes gene_type:complete
MDKKYLFSNGDSWIMGIMLDTEYMRNKYLSEKNITYDEFCSEIGNVDEYTWLCNNTDYHAEASEVKEKNKFSSQVSSKLGLEEINLSWEGKSNKAILRTTLEWILDNKDKVKDTFFLIGWTAPTRGEFVDGDSYGGSNDNESIVSELETLYIILNLQNYFKVNNIEYIFVDLFSDLFLPMEYNTRNPFDENYRMFSTSLSLYDNLLEELDTDNFFSKKSLVKIIEENVEGGEIKNGNQFCELPIENNYSKDTKNFIGHPSISSSKIIANLIYEKISGKGSK